MRVIGIYLASSASIWLCVSSFHQVKLQYNMHQVRLMIANVEIKAMEGVCGYLMMF
jgi:hypothetical protein